MRVLADAQKEVVVKWRRFPWGMREAIRSLEEKHGEGRERWAYQVIELHADLRPFNREFCRLGGTIKIT